MDTWQRVALAAGTPLFVKLQRDPLEDAADAGHLAIQDLLLGLGRRAGYEGLFELATRPSEPWRSIDVGLRDDRKHTLVLCECWNSFGDVGAAARSASRELAEAEAFAMAIWGDAVHLVTNCWVVRDTRRNRELVRRYPEVFRSMFPGSSAARVRALTEARSADGAILPPAEPGLIWSDVGATRVFAWRQRFE